MPTSVGPAAVWQKAASALQLAKTDAILTAHELGPGLSSFVQDREGSPFSDQGTVQKLLENAARDEGTAREKIQRVQDTTNKILENEEDRVIPNYVTQIFVDAGKIVAAAGALMVLLLPAAPLGWPLAVAGTLASSGATLSTWTTNYKVDKRGEALRQQHQVAVLDLLEHHRTNEQKRKAKQTAKVTLPAPQI